jgi:hypothetical protein
MCQVYLQAPEENPTAVSGRNVVYWDELLPLHAALVQHDKNEGPVQDSPTQVEEEEQGVAWWSRRRRRRTVQTPLSALAWRIVAPHANLPPARGPDGSGTTAETSSSPSNAEIEMVASKPTPVTVAMLIAMPRPPPKTLNNTSPTDLNGEEVCFPHLELGVAEVVVLPLSESDRVEEERDGHMA